MKKLFWYIAPATASALITGGFSLIIALLSFRENRKREKRIEEAQRKAMESSQQG